MKKRIQQLKAKRAENKLIKSGDSIESVPRITNENVAEHRKDILSGAKKYIYPLQHSKHRIIILSTSLFLVVLLIFSIFTTLSLYRFETRSGFMYQVTKVLPLPIARSGGTFIAYENYLFDLNHYIHYYENQQQLSFETEAGQAQLASYKERTINRVINDAYVKMIAKDLGLSVDSSEIDEQIRIAREQNRLGSSDEIFEDVLREFWNWSLSDFRRTLNSELLAQKVIVASDSGTEARATEALARLTAGEDFAAIAAEYSDDLGTKELGGEFGLVNKSNRNVSQQAADVLFNLGENQFSGIIAVPYGTGFALAIIKNLGEQGDKRNGAHIIFQLKSLDEVLNDKKEQQPYRLYMNPIKG